MPATQHSVECQLFALYVPDWLAAVFAASSQIQQRGAQGGIGTSQEKIQIQDAKGRFY